MKNIKYTILYTLPYFLIALSAALLAIKKDSLPELVAKNIAIISYSIFFVSALVSIKFRRSRVFFVLLLLALSFMLFFEAASIEKRIEFFESYLKVFLSVALPINILLFALFKERGFFTVIGVSRILFIASQFLAIFILAYYKNTQFFDLFYIDFIPPFVTKYIALSDTAITVTLLSFFIILIKTIKQKSHIDIGFLISVLLSFLAVNFSDKIEIMALFFISSALILFFSIISESHHIAFYDELTNIPARRALMEELAKLGRKYTIAMVDIDHFKKFNDTHGHDIGDAVLKLVASNLSHTTGGAKAFRYGGEEFTIVFPKKSTEEAKIHLEEIREKISKTPYTLKNQKTKKPKTLFVTVSIGMAQKTSKEKTPQEVMKQADNALYKAKKAGRNKVCE
ncbi:MAG: hypothetical protein QG567_856 [Campylobacterota bacterium]|nr:hypothetical protein [Campylobacterota bacterium]